MKWLTLMINRNKEKTGENEMVTQSHNLVCLDATPMFADVFSGAVPRPEPFVPSPPETPWQEKRCWWYWAAQTLAGRRALEFIKCPIPPDAPWEYHDDWRLQPWIDEGKPANDSDNQFDNAVNDIRDFLGEPLAGVIYAEISAMNFATCHYERSHHTFIAINIDGTRAAICKCGWE